MNWNKYIIQTIIRRIIYILIGALVAFITHEAKAETGARIHYFAFDIPKDFAADACRGMYGSNVYVSSRPDIGEAVYSCNNESGVLIEYLYPTYYCDDGSTPNSDHICGSTPPPPNICESAAGGTLTGVHYTGSPSISSVCKAGCTVKLTGVGLCLDGGDCISDGVVQNESCTPNNAPPSTPQSDCLKKGKSYGTVNGTVVCVPASSAGAAPVTTTSNTTINNTTNNTTNNTSTTTNSSSTIISRSNGDGTATQTTTTDNGDGTTSTKQETTDNNTFCEKNPSNKLCKDDEKSSFGGSCFSAFTCDGDAIQCAIAKEQHQKNCTLFNDQTDESSLGTAMKNGTDTGSINNPALNANRTEVDLSNAIDEGSNIGGGVFADKHISLAGGGLDIPFSNINWIMQLLGTFILAAAYINAARIVGVR